MWRNLNNIAAKRQAKAGRAQNPILSSEMVASMFQPALTEKAAASIERTTTWSNSQWGLGLALNRDDCPGRRRKNSGFCTFAFIIISNFMLK